PSLYQCLFPSTTNTNHSLNFFYIFFFFLMIRRPPRSTLELTSFPTRRSSDLIHSFSQSSTCFRSIIDPVLSLAITFRRSEEHTSELQSRAQTSYAVLCSKKKRQPTLRRVRNRVRLRILRVVGRAER